MTQTADRPQTKAVVPYLRQFSDEEKGLLASLLAQVAPKATNDEKRMFLYQAQKKGLDPFVKQIYLVPRWDAKLGREVYAVQVSIDGLRLMAQRSGKYAGQTPYQWCGPDGKWVDVWLSDDHPVAARCGILRHDFKEPLYSVALFKSYKQTKKDGGLNIFWDKYGAHMLAKCAEALSIRRGFPEETSGFYIPEEMGNPELVYVSETEQDDNAPIAESEVVAPEPPKEAEQPKAKPATQPQANGHQADETQPALTLGKLFLLGKERGLWSDTSVNKFYALASATLGGIPINSKSKPDQSQLLQVQAAIEQELYMRNQPAPLANAGAGAGK